MTALKSFNYQQTKFLISAPDISHLPEDTGIEIAFAGRSNAGKSTCLNVLTGQKNLAKTSKTPGRTQLINLFEVAEGCKIVDLPGYGYAAVPKAMKDKWQKALSIYLEKRECLKALVILMDIRHPLKDLDQHMIGWAVQSGLPVLLVLTKADKLSQKAQNQQVKMVREAILPFGGEIYVEFYSGLKKTGIAKVRKYLDKWFLEDIFETLNEEDHIVESEEVSG